MNPAAITVIINGNSYSLSASNVEAIRTIPAADRQQLVALLELVKQQESTATEAASTAYHIGEPISPQARRSERLGSGDVDALVAQLMMEEKAKQKPGVTKGTIYKWIIGVAVVVVLLVSVL